MNTASRGRQRPGQGGAPTSGAGDQEAVSQAKRYRYWICSTIFLCYLLVFFHRLCPAVIALDIQATFGLSDTV